MDSDSLQRRLRGAFDRKVMNHGDYNLVFAQPSGSATPYVIGYRRAPRELVLCPVDVQRRDLAQATGVDDIVVVDFHNVATVTDTGSGYQVESVTGFRTWFEVSPATTVHVGPLSDSGMARLDQDEDAEDFHRFMSEFMDELDDLYPDLDMAEKSC